MTRSCMKGWALTVAGAFYGFAVKGTSWRVAAIGLMPVAGLLGPRRVFPPPGTTVPRPLRPGTPAQPAVEPFAMNAAAYATGVASWGRTLVSRTLAPFYGPVFIIGIVLTAILR